MNTLERLVKLVHEKFDQIEGEIGINSKLVEDLHLDRLDMYEMVVDVEDSFNISIPKEKLEQIHTVGDIVEIINREQAKENISQEKRDHESIIV